MNQHEVYKSNSYGPARIAYDSIRKKFKELEFHFEGEAPWVVTVNGVSEKIAMVLWTMLNNAPKQGRQYG